MNGNILQVSHAEQPSRLEAQRRRTMTHLPLDFAEDATGFVAILQPPWPTLPRRTLHGSAAPHGPFFADTSRTSLRARQAGPDRTQCHSAIWTCARSRASTALMTQRLAPLDRRTPNWRMARQPREASRRSRCASCRRSLQTIVG